VILARRDVQAVTGDVQPIGGFAPIAVNGWGDGLNSYAHSMTWFEDRLYVGSARANLYLISRRQPKPQWPVYPVNCPADPFVLDLCAEIWRYDPRERVWEHVFKAPMVPARVIPGANAGTNGVGPGGVVTANRSMVPRDIGYRGMFVFQGRSDPKPVLYVSTYSPTRGPGPMILRSEDGVEFAPAGKPGFGYENVSAFRGLVPFKGRLYASPIGATQNRPNASTYPMVFETDDPAHGEWRPVSERGFGNPQNVAVFELAVMGDWLYGGTLNVVTGFELWKTRAEGEPPYEWTQVLRLGAYRGNLNQGTLSMCVFKDALYIGTAIQDGGFDRANKVGPAAGEIIRVHPDDSWDLLVGSSRLTPIGFKVARSGLGPGFKNFFNTYIWRMCVHNDWLYVGTWDWSTFLPYSPFAKWPAFLRELFENLGVEQFAAKEEGCDVWRTKDGLTWEPVTRDGFGNRYNCGARTLVSTPHGLAIGSANPFGGEVAVKRGDRWEYVPNPRGGLEVWLGEPVVSACDASPDSTETNQADRPAHLPRRGHMDLRSSEFEWMEPELRKARKRIDIPSVMPEVIAFARKFNNLRAEGLDHLPRSGPFLIVCNHLATPLWSKLMVEDTPMIAHLLYERLRRPIFTLGSRGFFYPADVRRATRKVVERLGFVPITIGNGVRLLKMGEVVMIHPEGDASDPGYQTKPFYWGFAKMAFMAEVPIVPAAFIGPHESRPPIVLCGQQHRVNMLKPLPADYKLMVLPPLDVREHIKGLDDEGALREFTELVRGHIQAALDRECEHRPMVKIVRALQAQYGDVAPRLPASAAGTTNASRTENALLVEER
jgi:1-acyl-sn-glycerol-3-phosphate acyltransferase